MSKEIAPSLFVETVHDIIDRETGAATPTPPRPAGSSEQPPTGAASGTFTMPILPDYEFEPLEPGIWFGVPDEVYHALPYFNASGVKKMAGSPMLYWGSTPWLNEAAAEWKAEKEKGKDHLPAGKAYHCRLLEGAAAFAACFAPVPDESLFEGCIESTDDIKNEIIKAGEVPLTRVPTGEMTADPKKPGEMKALTRAAKKDDWIDQLLELDPEVRLLDREKAAYRELHAGKTLLPHSLIKRIEIAAMMVERDPGIATYLKDGHAEVTLVWNCPDTGIPMKARVDYLRLTELIDLKTVANQRERAFDSAIAYEIESWKLLLQPAVYLEGAQEVRKIVRQHGASAVHTWGDGDEKKRAEYIDWALQWASYDGRDEWGWIFQAKGLAPISRLVWHAFETKAMIMRDVVRLAKKQLVECAEIFGTDPWLDIKPPYWMNDEDVRESAVEI